MVEGTVALEEQRLLEHLYTLAGSRDSDFAAEMLVAFLDATAESIHTLDAALERPKLDVVARAAHRLKSSFATLEMEQGVEACTALEAAARMGDVEEVRRAAEAVRAQRHGQAAGVHRLLAHLQAGVCKAG